MNTVSAANTQNGSSWYLLIVSFTALSQESACKKLYFSPICFSAVLLVQEKKLSVLSCCPSCSPVEAYTHPAGVPSQFLISRAGCQGSENQIKASHCMSHKCDGSTAADPDCRVRAIHDHLGLREVCSCLQDFQRNYYCSTATQCGDRFQYEESSFTQMWSEHYKARFWLVHAIRGWAGSWLNCCLILLFPTQGTCCPLRQCCSLYGPPRSLHQLLSQSICQPDWVSFLWYRMGNLTKPSCNCLLLCLGMCTMVLSNLGLKHRKVLLKGK